MTIFPYSYFRSYSREEAFHWIFLSTSSWLPILVLWLDNVDLPIPSPCHFGTILLACTRQLALL